MLSGIDRERLADELHELRLDLVAAEGEFTRDSIALAIENIGALLPEGCERLEDRSAADRVRRIKRLCEELAEIIDGETSVDVTFPDLARRCWQLARGLRGGQATCQEPEGAPGDDAPADAPADPEPFAVWWAAKDARKLLGFGSQKELTAWLDQHSDVRTRRKPTKKGTPDPHRPEVEILTALEAISRDVVILDDPVRMERIRTLVTKADIEKQLERATLEAFGIRK